METASASSGIAPTRLTDQTLAGLIVTCSLVQGADLSMFPATLKALEEHFSIDPKSLAFVLLLQGIAYAIAAPIWGVLADRYDRIKLLYLDILGVSLMTFLTGLSLSFPMLCAARLLTGAVAAGLGPIIQTMLASAVLPDSRSKFFSYLVVANNLGSSTGAVYGATFSHHEMYQHQGWRFTFITMSLFTSLVAATLFMMREYLSRTLCRAMANPIAEPWHISKVARDLSEIVSRRSFILLLCQGAFASAAAHSGSFLMEIFQYAGFADFQASTLVTSMSVGNIVGALGSGVWADECAKKYPASGRIIYGVFGNCLLLTILIGIAIGDFESFLNVRHYYELGAICFIFGVFQLFAYVGTVKPILSEIVPCRLAGQTLAYAAGIDGAIASIAGPPIVAAISQDVFQYQPTDEKVADMSRDLRRNNLFALAKAYFCVSLLSISVATVLVAMLRSTYQHDKEMSSMEHDQDERPDTLLRTNKRKQ